MTPVCCRRRSICPGSEWRTPATATWRATPAGAGWPRPTSRVSPASWRGTRWCWRSWSRPGTRTPCSPCAGSAAAGRSPSPWPGPPPGSTPWCATTWCPAPISPALPVRLPTTRQRPAAASLSVSLSPGYQTIITPRERTRQRRWALRSRNKWLIINIILHQVFFNKPTNQPEAAMTSIQKQYTQDPYRSDSR